MRIVAHDLAVFTRTGFGFVRVDHQIGRPSVAFLGHERPFQTGRETRATATAQTGRFHIIYNPIAALIDDTGRAIPRPTRHRALKAAIPHPVDVGKNAILICKHGSYPLRCPSAP